MQNKNDLSKIKSYADLLEISLLKNYGVKKYATMKKFGSKDLRIANENLKKSSGVDIFSVRNKRDFLRYNQQIQGQLIQELTSSNQPHIVLRGISGRAKSKLSSVIGNVAVQKYIDLERKASQINSPEVVLISRKKTGTPKVKVKVIN